MSPRRWPQNGPKQQWAEPVTWSSSIPAAGAKYRETNEYSFDALGAVTMTPRVGRGAQQGEVGAQRPYCLLVLDEDEVIKPVGAHVGGLHAEGPDQVGSRNCLALPRSFEDLLAEARVYWRPWCPRRR